MPFKSVDIAYAAGLYEGEGTLRIDRHYWGRDGERRSRRTPQVKIRLGMTDKEPLDRFAAIVGGGRVMGPYQYGKSSWKPFWLLDIDSPPLVREVLAAIYPFLSPRRQAQIDAALGEPAEEVA